MKRLLTATAAALIALASAGASLAQPYDRQHDQQGDHRDRGDHGDRGDHNGYAGHSGYVRHDDWRRGHRMERADWDRGERVDWRSHHLRHPPRGYEWRNVDGNYVLAAAATGLIASIVANSR